MLKYKIKCPVCGAILDDGKPKAVYAGKVYQCNNEKCLPGKVTVNWLPHETTISLSNMDYEATKDELGFEVKCEKASCLRTVISIDEKIILEVEEEPKKVFYPPPKPKKKKETKELKINGDN